MFCDKQTSVRGPCEKLLFAFAQVFFDKTKMTFIIFNMQLGYILDCFVLKLDYFIILL